MVWTSGLTRSKGRVSQAGSSATGPPTSPATRATSEPSSAPEPGSPGPPGLPEEPRKQPMSSASWSASAVVGVTTTRGPSLR